MQGGNSGVPSRGGGHGSGHGGHGSMRDVRSRLKELESALNCMVQKHPDLDALDFSSIQEPSSIVLGCVQFCLLMLCLTELAGFFFCVTVRLHWSHWGIAFPRVVHLFLCIVFTGSSYLDVVPDSDGEELLAGLPPSKFEEQSSRGIVGNSILQSQLGNDMCLCHSYRAFRSSSHSLLRSSCQQVQTSVV